MFQIIALSVCLPVVFAVEFHITNKESGEIWVGIQGNSGKPPLNNGGFVLGAGQTKTVTSPPDWAGRFWARTWCDGGTNHCLTGDCGNKVECQGNGGQPPASLAEITLKGDGGKDFYDISLVDGFNIPISIAPVGGEGDGSKYSCKSAGCKQYLNDACPQELRLNGPKGVVGCKSACEVFNTDEYCCRGAHGQPGTCSPSQYSDYFKNKCPDAYSFAYNDGSSTFTCKAEKYIITFGI